VGKGRLRGSLIPLYACLIGTIERREPDSSQKCPVRGKAAMSTNCSIRNSDYIYGKKKYSQCRVQNRSKGPEQLQNPPPWGTLQAQLDMTRAQ